MGLVLLPMKAKAKLILGSEETDARLNLVMGNRRLKSWKISVFASNSTEKVRLKPYPQGKHIA